MPTKTQIKKTTKAKTKFEEVTFIVNEFPKGTEEIFLTGANKELGEWLPEKALKMQYYQNEGETEQFRLTVKLPKNSEIEYKYLNHKTWVNVECSKTFGVDVPNRTITTKSTATRTVTDSVLGFRI